MEHLLLIPLYPYNFSTSSEDGQDLLRCCSLPTIAVGCSEEKESSIVDIEDIINESQNKSSLTFKTYLGTANDHK